MDPLWRALQANHEFSESAHRRRGVAYLSFRLEAGFGLLNRALCG